jgi:hypothetical protein
MLAIYLYGLIKKNLQSLWIYLVCLGFEHGHTNGLPSDIGELGVHNIMQDFRERTGSFHERTSKEQSFFMATYVIFTRFESVIF